MNERTDIRIGTWREDGEGPRLAFVAELELRVGDLAGDLAARGFQTVDHEPCPPGTLTLSACRSILDLSKRGDNRYISSGAGSYADSIGTEVWWEKGWNRDRFTHLAEIADRWHLNTMRAGCAHQEVVYETDRYGRRVPSLDLTPPCPETGYRYGSAWLVEPLPEDVLTFLAEIGVTP